VRKLRRKSGGEIKNKIRWGIMGKLRTKLGGEIKNKIR